VLLEVKDLKVTFGHGPSVAKAVDGVSFTLSKGEALGIVGESGSGKSVTSLSILNLLKSNATNETSGDILFKNEESTLNLISAKSSELYKIRGRKISMVFQEPMSSLNPVRKCGAQVKEVLDVHDIGPEESRVNAILNLFSQVALPDVQRIYNSYPHELSGGQLQRVSIAMALATRPDIIICDEPTTALDVTVQKEILELLGEVAKGEGISLIFISHDLDVVASLCDRVLVMYQGQIVEEGLLPDTFLNPKHSYTKALMTCKPTSANRPYYLPTVEEIIENKYEQVSRKGSDSIGGKPLIEVEGLKVYFPKRKKTFFAPRSFVRAVDGVSLKLYKGEILGIVGESGSGKSTLANCIGGLISQSDGDMLYDGKILSKSILASDNALRTRIQMIFQDPYSSLNPKMTIGKAISEPLLYHKVVDKSSVDNHVKELLEKVGLSPSYTDRYPHQLSGGQRQRVCIARAISVQPEVLICDESVSALDVSVQAQVLNLLDRLRSDLGVSMIFISHDLAVVHYLCERVLVMKDGKIVERGSTDTIMNKPQQDYTRRLIQSLPTSIM